MNERGESNISAAASGHGRIYQAGRDQFIHEGTLSSQSLRPVLDVAAPRDLASLPPKGEVFVGRVPELSSIRANLSTPGSVVVLSGLGGVGKSTLAAQYAWQNSGIYNPIWWITANNSAGLHAGLAHLIVTLQPELARALPMDESAERAIQWLNAHNDWLIILDDVTNSADVAALVSRVNTGRIIVTSRIGSGWHRINTTVIQVNVLPNDDALELLSRTLHAGESIRQFDPIQNLALVSRLGGLPLAIRAAAGYISATHIDVEEFLRQLSNYGPDLLDAPDAWTTLARTFHATFEQLADTPLALPLLRILSWYAYEGIPRLLIDNLTRSVDQSQLKHALMKLAAHSMLDVDAKSISMHRLLQTFIRTVDPQDPYRQPADIAAGLRQSTELLDSTLPQVHAPRDWPLWQRLIPHIAALADRASPESDTAVSAHLFNQTGLFLNEQGDARSSIAYHLRSCAAYSRHYGRLHRDTLAALGNLAGAYQAAGDLAKAVPLYEQTLSECEQSLDQDDPFVLSARNDLASAYVASSNLAAAIPIYEQTLADRVRVLGRLHPATLTSLNNLAYAHQVAGNLKQSIPLFEQALAKRERVLGDRHLDTLASRHNLAASLHFVNRSRDAVRLLERNLDTREQILGGDHPDTLASRNSLAYARLSVGDVYGALPLLEETLTARERILGGDHPDTLTSLSNLAYAYEMKGELTYAIQLYQRTLAGCERVLGSDHPDTLAARSNLAGSYRAIGELEKAVPLFEQTLTDSVRVLGESHPSTLALRNNLAGAYESLGNLDRAIPLYEQTLTDRVRTLGEDHPDTLASRNNLAGAYESLGDLGRAVPLYEQTLTDSVRVLGEDHPDTLASRNNLAYTYRAAGDLGRAVPLYEQTLTDFLRVLGEDHPSTLISRNNLAGAYESLGDLDRAVPLYEQTLTDSVRVLGEDHPDTLALRNNLAGAYESLGDLDRAIRLYERAFADSVRLHGDGHPTTLRIRRSLRAAYLARE
ncbi:tetratricopeptide repeat protein [Streptomyces sp. NPDC057456]|uniref:tetratricopeptide repeat protein n=1 Tax=Streptomyces sp. NPDC057456 TaxID=3346139 RepID=UPI00368C8DCD